MLGNGYGKNTENNMTVKKYTIDENAQKKWNSQNELVVPAKAPQVISLPKPDGKGNYQMQRKVGEETKIYSAPEHYPKKSKHFGHPEEFERKFDKWMGKSRKKIGRVTKSKIGSISKYKYEEK
jgi:hypothetical protein